MTIKEALIDAAWILTGASPSPNLDAELLMGWLFDWDRAQLILRGGDTLSEFDDARYWELIHERRQGRPVQYLVRSQEFMGLPFYVDERVLIPRPDTEILVEAVLDALKPVADARVLDLCTGSGAIAVSLAVLRPSWSLLATDLSPDALEVARHNGEKLTVSQRISWHEGDLFEALPRAELLDAIVSNPPYIQSDIIPTLDVNVREYEPHMALDGGADGLDCYRRIVRGAVSWLKPGGLLALEIGYDQKSALLELLAENGHYEGAQCLQDLSGHDRVILARRTC